MKTWQNYEAEHLASVDLGDGLIVRMRTPDIARAVLAARAIGGLQPTLIKNLAVQKAEGKLPTQVPDEGTPEFEAWQRAAAQGELDAYNSLRFMEGAALCECCQEPRFFLTPELAAVYNEDRKSKQQEPDGLFIGVISSPHFRLLAAEAFRLLGLDKGAAESIAPFRKPANARKAGKSVRPPAK